ncbi:MBL fold metallo-hydrolase [Bailinhaonella thermotolerans]|uniref:MBL fold metallo-hydrolase n=1 Tax=Bailinhaonella thermotolerans TaxID=1070861 RepID=A0A3A4AYE4_9ACTN|nr:MBL fold metallo-hydrolase [Bailinhaonella thermotolerans]RJL30863.1 MBL fold metallo-hydrolase [Bailinhaonella thermotolerans]
MAIVTFLGHAGLSVEAADFTLLCDPWLDPRGAYLGSWHQYPRNDHLDVAALADADWVAVSHEHLDHMDPWFLSQLSPRTRVLIPKYPASAYRDRMMAAGVRNLVEIEPWEPFALDNHGSWITAIPEVSPMCHDAAFLVVADGHSVLNCNDARLTAAQARRAKHLAGGKLDLMGVQASGAAWHPMTYTNYTPEEVARIAAEKKLAKLRAVSRLVRSTEPVMAAPFAGPPVFLDPELQRFNWVLDRGDAGAYCDPEEAAEWLSERLPRVRWHAFKPGDKIDLATGEITPDPVSAKFSFTEGRDEYIQRYANDRKTQIARIHAENPEPGDELYPLFVSHFERLGTLSEYFNRNIDMTVRFDVTGPGGGRWDVVFAPGGITVGEAREEKPGYVITVAGRWLMPVLKGEIAWEDLMISMRLSFYRDPDVYNDYLVGLLKHANEDALRAVEEYETGRDESERIVVTGDDGTSYEIGRYCPHAGEDLSVGAVVRDGQVWCLGHNFAFDLKSGECVNARCLPLATRAITPTTT